MPNNTQYSARVTVVYIIIPELTEIIKTQTAGRQK